jgi:hypothetical protein
MFIYQYVVRYLCCKKIYPSYSLPIYIYLLVDYNVGK